MTKFKTAVKVLIEYLVDQVSPYNQSEVDSWKEQVNMIYLKTNLRIVSAPWKCFYPNKDSFFLKFRLVKYFCYHKGRTDQRAYCMSLRLSYSLIRYCRGNNEIICQWRLYISIRWNKWLTKPNMYQFTKANFLQISMNLSFMADFHNQPTFRYVRFIFKLLKIICGGHLLALRRVFFSEWILR